MRTLRLIFTFLSGLLLISFSGCGGGRAGGDNRKSGGDNSKSGENPAPSTVWLDNYTPRACVVTADGEQKGTLKPFASLQLKVAPGTHTFVLTCEGQPAETLKADLPAGKSALVRPASAGDYQLLTCTYTATGPSAARGDIRLTPAPKTGVILADYGPCEEFPETLKVDEGFAGGPNEGAKTATRTRLIRSLPADPDGFLALPEDAARALLVQLTRPPAPEELRRRVVVLGLRRPEKGLRDEACAAIADKDFVPDEEVVEALTAVIDALNPDEGDNRATIKHCSSCLVDAFYRHPAVVARPKTRRFLVRFAHPQLEPTLENARHALIDGRCASDLVPIYIHYTRDVRIEMIGYLVTASKKREAVSQDVIELYRASLADEDTEVRVAAAKALPQLAAFMTQDNLSAFQDLLVRALSDPSFEVHHEAARALEVNGFVPNEQIANQLISAWRQLDKGDPQGQANRDRLAKALKTSFEKNPGTEADRSWRERALAAFAQP